MKQAGGGVVSASVLAMVLVGGVSGALIGLLLGNILTRQLPIAILSALVAATLALIIGNRVLGEDSGPLLPAGVRSWNLIVAAIIGGLAGHELGIDVTDTPSSAFIGALAGLLAAVLIASFAITMFTVGQPVSNAER